MFLLVLFLQILSAATLTKVLATTWSPFRPTSLPLAVKSSYLNVWLPLGNSSDSSSISNSWPYLWPSSSADSLLGWKGLVVVDNETYWIMGDGEDSSAPRFANVTSVTFSPTKTTFTMSAGPVNVQLDFLSPLEVDDLTRLSIPFVYLYTTVTSSDGNSHAVRVGMAFTAELISGNHKVAANASSIVNDGIVALQMQLQVPDPFSEINDHPQDASAYIATTNGPGTSFEVSSGSGGVPNSMANVSTLSNTLDSNYSSHALNSPFDNYGIMVDIPDVRERSTPVVFTIGIVREPSIRYTALSGETQFRFPYYKANFSTANDLITFVLNDFNRSSNVASTIDNRLTTAATNISPSYADLISLTARQSWSALDVTISQAADGSLNMSDVKVFFKDMGGVDSGGVNAVSVLYSALPMYLYLAPNLLSPLLRPLLDAQADPSRYTLPYASQYLGTNYPNATAQNIAHNFAIEESANMLILTLAHAQVTKDYSLITNFYDLYSRWGQYLSANALSPGNQQISPLDSVSGSNQTNLALKGIIGIAAMGRISTLLGKTQDANTYNSTASESMRQWLSLSTSSDGSHIKTTYGDQSTTGLLHSLFADKILELNLVPASIYTEQTQFYKSLQGQSSTKGLPISSYNPAFSRIDWTMLTAATCTENGVRDSFVSWAHQVASTTFNNTPLGIVVDPQSNVITGGTNSPALGSMFAILALAGSTSADDSQSGSKHAIAPIVGAIVGGVGALTAFIIVALATRKRRRNALKKARSVIPFEISQTESTISRPQSADRDHKRRDGSSVSFAPVSVESGGSRQDERSAREEGVALESELRTLRTQVNRLLDQRHQDSSRTDALSRGEHPPSYDSD